MLPYLSIKHVRLPFLLGLIISSGPMALTRATIAAQLRVMRVVVGCGVANVAASVALTGSLTSAAAAFYGAQRPVKLTTQLVHTRSTSIRMNRA